VVVIRLRRQGVLTLIHAGESWKRRISRRACDFTRVSSRTLVPQLLGLLITSVIFDIIYLDTSDNRWTAVAEYMIGAGVLCGRRATVL